MPTTTRRTPTGPAQSRRITITATDGNGRPAGAQIKVDFDGLQGGTIDLGTGSKVPTSIEVNDPRVYVGLTARFLGKTIRADLSPGQDQVEFKFSGTARFGVSRAAVAHCPDGTSGSPCVKCRDANSGKEWEMCC